MNKQKWLRDNFSNITVDGKPFTITKHQLHWCDIFEKNKHVMLVGARQIYKTTTLIMDILYDVCLGKTVWVTSHNIHASLEFMTRLRMFLDLISKPFTLKRLFVSNPYSQVVNNAREISLANGGTVKIVHTYELREDEKTPDRIVMAELAYHTDSQTNDKFLYDFGNHIQVSIVSSLGNKNHLFNHIRKHESFSDINFSVYEVKYTDVLQMSEEKKKDLIRMIGYENFKKEFFLE